MSKHTIKGWVARWVGVGALLIATVACTVPTWVAVVENLAVTGGAIAVQVANVADPQIVPIVQEADTLLNLLVKEVQQYSSNPNATTLQSIQSVINNLQTNEAALDAAILASPKTDATITLVIGTLDAVINSLVADLPPTAQAKLHMTAKPGPIYHSAAEAEAAFNHVIKSDPRFSPLQ